MPWNDEIEAAAEAMMRSMFADHELPLDDELRQKYFNTAKEALFAVEEVQRTRPKLALDDVSERSKFEIRNGGIVLKEPSSEIDRLKCALIEARIELAKTPKFVELLNDMAKDYDGIGNASVVLREVAKQLPVELGGEPN